MQAWEDAEERVLLWGPHSSVGTSFLLTVFLPSCFLGHLFVVSLVFIDKFIGMMRYLMTSSYCIGQGIIFTILWYAILEKNMRKNVQFSSFQLLSHVWLFATPWTAAHQASLSITISQSLLKLMSIMSVMPSNHLILCCPLLLLPSIFPSIRVFSNKSVLPLNIQDWFPLGWTGWISLQSKGVFSNTTV